MKCPLSMAMLGSYSTNVMVEPRDCLQEKCMWYHPTTLSCEVSRIASNLSTIAGYLGDSCLRIPPENIY